MWTSSWRLYKRSVKRTRIGKKTIPFSVTTGLTQSHRAYSFKTLAIYSNVSKSRVLGHLEAGEVEGCGVSVPALTSDDIDDAAVIVGQIGPEPFLSAMSAEPDFDIIISGRAYDPSPYIAYCVHQATDHINTPLESLAEEELGGYAFMGKIMECGALCATPKSWSSMATVYHGGIFDIVPLSPEARCTPTSVAAHTLYEKSRPDLLPGPGGDLDLSNSRYTQLDDNRTVRVSGSTFRLSRKSSKPYTLKLEAAKVIGQRSMLIGGIRDPILIGQIDNFLARVKDHVTQQYKDAKGTWEIEFHVYGAKGIMGNLEPGDPSYQPREIFLVGEALASSQALATSVASTARIACVHGPYPGQRGIGGNFAMGVGGKMELEMGPCAEFCLYHLIPLAVGEEGADEIIDSATQQPDGEVSSHTTGQKQRGLFSWKKLQIGLGEPSSTLINGTAIDSIDSAGVKRTSQPPKRPSAPPTKLNLYNPQTLCDIAPVVRSKNSGPYDITLDVIFSDPAIYKIIKRSNLLTTSLIARLYHLREDEIIWSGFYDQAMAWKATVPRKGLRGGVLRPVASGSYMEADVHASQQYVGLLELQLTREIRREVTRLSKGHGDSTWWSWWLHLAYLKRPELKTVITALLSLNGTIAAVYGLIALKRRGV